MKNALILLLLLAGSAYAGGVYKWLDSSGNVQYSDTPPPADAKNVERLKAVESVIQASEAPYGLQQAMNNFPVTLWANDCGEYCDKARALLGARGVPYTEKDPQQPDNGKLFKAVSGGDMGIPLLQIGELSTLQGFEEGAWNSALDVAGYPRSAPAVRVPAGKAAVPTASAEIPAPPPVAQPAPAQEPANAP